MHLMVPKGGFEPPRGLPTTPSRWRVYQFHHFGKIINPSQPPLPTGRQALVKGGKIIPPFIKGDKGGLFLRLRCGHLRSNRHLRGRCGGRGSRSFLHDRGGPFR
jgi:hypothetical protein